MVTFKIITRNRKLKNNKGKDKLKNNNKKE